MFGAHITDIQLILNAEFVPGNKTVSSRRSIGLDGVGLPGVGVFSPSCQAYSTVV